MRHRKFTFKIGKSSAHRRSLLANAVNSLITHGRIETTVVRAKQIRRFAEKMVTLGKRGDLHAKRQASAFLRQPTIVMQLFAEVAPRYQDRQGGYTRILRLSERRGDAAEMCLLEWVDFAPAGVAAEVVAAPAEEKKA
jgi:large subunit ribosomal protein L17